MRLPQARRPHADRCCGRPRRLGADWPVRKSPSCARVSQGTSSSAWAAADPGSSTAISKVRSPVPVAQPDAQWLPSSQVHIAEPRPSSRDGSLERTARSYCAAQSRSLASVSLVSAMRTSSPLRPGFRRTQDIVANNREHALDSGSYASLVSKNRNVSLSPLKSKGFKEEIVTKIGLYDLLEPTTLESNKSLWQL